MSNKTKEQLKDIKLFADFIGDGEHLEELKKYDEDTKQEIVIDYWHYRDDHYTPLDWNLLHKAYEKAVVLFKSTKNIDLIKLAVNIEGQFRNTKEDCYKDILRFIKYYNQINTNTNNNQS